jgi:hypothetical protein
MIALFETTGDTVVTVVAFAVIVVCLCVLAWVKTHPDPRRDRDQALEDYARRVEQDKAERESGD